MAGAAADLGVTTGQPPTLRRGERGPALMRQGYPYAQRLRGARDAARTRVAGRRAFVLGGSREAVQLFYDESRLRRRGAIPAPVRLTLFGPGAVHGLDDAAHKARKRVFLQLLSPEAAKAVAAAAAHEWQAVDADEVRLFDTAARIHTSAITQWAGIAAGDRYPQLTADLLSMIDGFGKPGPRMARAALGRTRATRWAAGLVKDVRAGRSTPPAGSALATFAALDVPAVVAGVELLNVVRPTVAVSWFVEFSGVAFREHDGLRAGIAAADDELLESFVHELRRVYPFVPVLGARVRAPFEWRGTTLPKNARVLLDVWGTLHDEKMWQDAARFDAARFVGQEPDADALIPQGGGPLDGHRCPGERVTIELIKVAARWLARTDHDITSTDDSIPLTDLPTRPRGPVVLARPRRSS